MCCGSSTPRRAFGERRGALTRLCRDLVVVVREDGAGLDDARRRSAEQLAETLAAQCGYQRVAAADTAVVLLRERFDTTI